MVQQTSFSKSLAEWGYMVNTIFLFCSEDILSFCQQ